MPPPVGGRHERETRVPDTLPESACGAVGAAAAATVTVALAVAVAPEALVAVIVNVVVALMVTDVEPDVPTALPLMTALTALVVDQVTSTLLLACRTAVMLAVGLAGGGGDRSMVASADDGPYS